MTGDPVVVIGAGPAGLTAAIELLGLGRQVVVVEESHSVGGLSRTVEHDGWRFDIGGHRFYTKVAEIEELWHAWLGPDDFVRRSRASRIYYRGRWFDYPLRIRNVLANLGPLESVRCLASYGAARFRVNDRSTFEGWVSARFGRRLYEIFFRSYTEKVWGVPARDLPADWAAQRIKTLSLGRAILDSIGIGRGLGHVTRRVVLVPPARPGHDVGGGARSGHGARRSG